MNLKLALSEIRNNPKFQVYWFISITVLGLLLSQLLDKFMNKASAIGLGGKISLAEVIIAIVIVIISIISIISIAVVYNNCMSRVVEAHENCKKRANEAHINCENHIHKLKTTVIYKEEISSTNGITSDDFGRKKEAGYNILARYIEKAENKILQVTSAPFGNVEEADYPSRKEYFETLEKKIESKKDCHDFKFTRIHQVQRVDDQLPAIDVVTKRFYENIINTTAQYGNIGLLKVETNRLYGFTIIDEKYLIIQMSGLKNDKYPVESGIFIFDDYDGSSIIKDFLRYFDAINSRHQTKPIELSELKVKTQ
jgi:hypothetical protein